MKEEGCSENQLDVPFYLATITADQKKEIQDSIVLTRKSARLHYVASFLPIVICLGVGILLCYLFSSDHAIIMILAIFFGAIISWTSFKAAQAKADKKIARVSVPMILESIYGGNSSFNPYTGISREIVDESNLIRLGNKYSSDGLIKASYKDVDFVVSNILSQNIQSDGKNSHTVTYFQGIFAIFPFNKEIYDSVEIREEEAGFGMSLFFSSKDKIDMEDIEFNKQFNVYATDKEAAFYVITPQLIEVFKEIKKKIPGNLIFCVRKNKIIIAINNGFNKFEYHESGNNIETYLKSVIDELLPYRWLIDVLGLDDKISASSEEEDEEEIDSLLKN